MASTARLPQDYFFFWLWSALALSSIVIFEPAPYDLFIMLLFAASFLLGKLRFPIEIKLGIGLLFIFTISNLFSMFEVYDVPRGAMYLFITFYLIISWIFFVGIVSNYGERALKVIFSGYTFAAIFSALSGVLAFLQLIPFPEVFMKFGRATGLFKDPNVFGPFLVPIAIYSIFRIVNTEKMARMGWMLSFGVTTSGVLLSFSRAAWGNYIIALFFFLLLWGVKISPGKIVIKKKLISLAALLFFLLGILTVVVVNNESILSFLSERFAIQHYDTERFSTQETAFSQVLSDPIGVGPGQSELIYDYATHSLYARVITENGFLGFISFIGFLLVTLYRAIKLFYRTHNSIYAVVFCSLIGLMVNSVTIDSLHWRHFWLLLAIPWTADLIPQNKSKRGGI